MTIEQLKSLHAAEPFRPFVLKLADGREFPVHRREYFAMSPSGKVIVVAQLDDSLIYTEINAVEDIEPLSEVSRSASV